MVKRELTETESISVAKIMKELCGYSVEEAAFILRTVAAKIKECAVIEEGD